VEGRKGILLLELHKKRGGYEENRWLEPGVVPALLLRRIRSRYKLLVFVGSSISD